MSQSDLQTTGRFLCNAEDIVARDATDAASLLSVDRIQAIFQSIGQGIIVVDEQGKLELFNREAEELLGIGIHDIPLEQWSETNRAFLPDGTTPYPPEELPLARVIRGEEVCEAELVIRHAIHGQPVPIVSRATPIRGDGGRLEGSVVVFHDITQRKQAEREAIRARDELETRVEARTAELRASEARFQGLYDNAPDIFASFDAATRCLLRCNQAFVSATGFSKQEVLGRATFELFHIDCLPALRKAFRCFIETGSVRDVELKLLRKDGETIDVSLNVSAVRSRDGRVLYGQSVLRDITERKRAEQRIREQQEELAHFARFSTMGEMAAGLAHEINQPLAAIAAYAEGASLRISSGMSDVNELAQIFQRIAADAHRAGEVIRRLRLFVRKRDVERSLIDTNELVGEVCQFLRFEIAHQEVDVDLRLSERLPRLEADAIGVQQVILNLVRNALDALAEIDPANRRLVIRTSLQAGRRAEVTVEDSGPGISGNLLEQVFEPFFTSKNAGLGMGLAISRSIIESHGGRIWTGRSNLGGASIHFSLPLGEEKDADE